MKDFKNNEQGGIGIVVVGIIILMIVGAIYTISGYHQIDAGHEGVLYSWEGGIMQEPLQPGLKWIDPLRTSLKAQISVQEQVYNTETDAGTSDMQPIHSKLSINYRIKAGHTPYVYQNIAGGDVLGVLISPTLPDVYKSVTSDYKVDELLPNRDFITAKTKDKLNAQFRDSFVEITRVNVIDFGFDPAFQQSIVRKQVAEQDIKTEVNILEQKKYQRDQAIVTAQGQAEAMRIQAQALRENTNLIGWEQLQVQREWIKRWTGVQPQFLMGGSTDGKMPDFILPVPAAK